MAVSLIKIEYRNYQRTLTDTLDNHDSIKCRQCNQSYEFGYSTGEQSHLEKWRELAKQAISDAHPEHRLETIDLATLGNHRETQTK